MTIRPARTTRRLANRTVITRSLVGVGIVGSLALGVTGVAGAATPGDGTVAAERTFDCDTAQARVAKLLERLEEGKSRIAKAEARIEELRANGHEELADRLARRVERLKAHLAKATAKAEKLADRVDERCDAA